MTRDEPRNAIVNFCILTTQRSGSTWFKDLLDSHPKICALSELFLNRIDNPYRDSYIDLFCRYRRTGNAMRPWVTFKYLRHLERYPGDNKAIGFKLMYLQLCRTPEIFPYFLTNNYKILHLTRENYLDVLVSGAVVRKTGIAHSTQPIEVPKITLEIPSLLKKLKRHDATIKVAKLVLKISRIPVMELTYESLREDREGILAKVEDFLGIEHGGVSHWSERKKITDGSLKETVENYEEVKEVLEGTKFEKFLGK